MSNPYALIACILAGFAGFVAAAALTRWLLATGLALLS